MKKNNTCLLATLIVLLGACSEDELTATASSLKVIHAASGAPPLHVDYFLDGIVFSNNSRGIQSFGSNQRYTLDAGATRDIRFSYTSDTTSVVLNIEVTPDPYEIGTIYLLGDSANLRGFYEKDNIFNFSTTDLDSAFATRLYNLSPDIGQISLRSIALDTTGIQDTTIVANSIASESVTDFNVFDNTSKYVSYTFQILNDADEIVGSSTVTTGTSVLSRSITLALIGVEDDGAGGTTLTALRINHY